MQQPTEYSSELPPDFRAQIENELGIFFVYDFILLGILHEGVLLDITNAQFVTAITEKYFDNTSYVYISARYNAYAIDPALYKYFDEIPNLQGMAVVNKRGIPESLWKIEKHFCQKPMDIFDNTDSAFLWARSLVE